MQTLLEYPIHLTLRVQGNILLVPFWFMIVAFLSCSDSVNQPREVVIADPPLISDLRTEWLGQHATQLRTIDPSDLDFTDLQPIAASIGSSRIVFLGEESHGDGAAFLAKTRLVKFLHERMGFDVLAFESGIYDCYKAWQFLQKGESPVIAFRRAVFPVWTLSSQVQALIDYVGASVSTARPLELAGVDCQFTGSASSDFLVADLTHYLVQSTSAFVQRQDWPLFAAQLDSLARSAYAYNSTLRLQQSDVMMRCVSLSAHLDTLARINPSASSVFWSQLGKSLISAASQQFAYSPSADFRSGQTRDLQMGRNLLWLATEPYRDRKIIVWAANYHIMRNADHIQRLDSSYTMLGYITMGHLVWESLKDQTYILGFTAYEGTAAPVSQSPWDIGKPPKESFENLLRSAGLQNAVVDLRTPSADASWLRQKLASQLLGYSTRIADWPNVIDGFVFTRVMTPSTRSSR